MGLFPLFKKKRNSDISSLTKSPTSVFTCDFITGNPDYKNATVTLNIPENPGYFKINDTLYEANFYQIRDIGVCAFNIYDRIAAGDWLFYVLKGTGPEFMNALMDTRNQAVKTSISKIEERPLSEYIPADTTLYDQEILFRISGVSHNYGANTQKIISRMSVGSPLQLRLWPDAPEQYCQVCVFDNNSNQIGYINVSDSFLIGEEILKQMNFGVRFSATLSEKGIVDGKNIWWCELRMTVKFPYPKDSEMIYSNGLGGAYHCKKGCSGATEMIPMYLAEKFDMRPCKRCHKLPKNKD